MLNLYYFMQENCSKSIIKYAIQWFATITFSCAKNCFFFYKICIMQYSSSILKNMFLVDFSILYIRDAHWASRRLTIYKYALSLWFISLIHSYTEKSIFDLFLLVLVNEISDYSRIFFSHSLISCERVTRTVPHMKTSIFCGAQSKPWQELIDICTISEKITELHEIQKRWN